MDEVKKYVCTSEDLDKLLPDGRNGLPDLRKQFQDLFSDNWRLRYVSRKEYEDEYANRHGGQRIERDPNESDEAWKNRRRDELQPIKQELEESKFAKYFKLYGIDYENPTVRDAVAFDLVKLDDDSVSNDNIYTYDERKDYSPMEYERYLLNRNFRINLVNLDPDWSNISYKDDESEQILLDDLDETILHAKRKPTVDRVYQGPRLSKTLLDYFSQVMDNGSSSNIYIPFTNANDFSIETSLIPNTHPDFRQITSRAYYDMKWAQYKRLLQSYGISAISTFALVDPKKDKNHTGEYLVKIQYKVPDNTYKYLVTTIDKDGHVVSEPVISQEPTTDNTILCVCESDFALERAVPTSRQRETWNPTELDEYGNPKGIRDIPMVHSTTSSHYSIFRQRIPDYDLKLVRHYIQFKNRLEGMQLCLEQVKRDLHHKEVHSAECFSKLTMILKRLMDNFADNKQLMVQVKKFYDLYSEWDKLTTKKIQIGQVRNGKLNLLQRLQAEYNDLSNNQLDKKLALGQKIGSLKLELDKSIDGSLTSIQERLDKIVLEMNEINCAIKDIQSEIPDEWIIPKEISDRITSEITDSSLSQMQDNMEQWNELMHQKVDSKTTNAIQGDLLRDRISEDNVLLSTNTKLPNSLKKRSNDNDVIDDRPALETLDTSKLHRLVAQSERWRNYSFNMGYELSQFKKMVTMCEDATIKVRRLLHNFEERMADTQEQVWDKRYNIKNDFDFKNITVAGLRDVILLHDWWAANALGIKPEDIGMTYEEFTSFRKRCNKISYNLRKNQYIQLLSVQKDRIERRISELEDIIKDKKTLHWDDKYGWDAPRDEGNEAWTPDKANAKARERIRLLAMAQDIIDESKEDTTGRMVSPTKQTLNKRKVASFVDVELEDEDVSNKLIVPTKHQLMRRRIVENVVNEEMTYRECAKLEKQYRSDSKELVNRTVNYLKSLGLIESEDDIEHLATLNFVNQSPEVSQRWISEIDEQKNSLDSAKELMQTQRKSMQSIIDNVIKMEEAIKDLKQKNKRIYDICMKSRKKIKGVDKQVRNNMLMDKLNNEQKIFELKSLIKKAKSQHLEDFSALEKVRKNVDEKQKAYDKTVKEFKTSIGLTQENIDNLMVGIYNKFQDEILEHSKKRK